MYMLGIDVGSSFLKSSILNYEEMQVEDTRSIPTPGFLPLSPERKEIPMDQVAEAVRELIEAAGREYPLEGIVFSVQMHGFMLFDPEGNRISNYISWQDMRGSIADESGSALIDRLRREIPEPLLAENGIHLEPNHSLLPLCHYIEEHQKMQGEELAMMGDGLIRLLTGQKVSLHPTVAASSGLYSLRKRDWNRELIRELGMEGICFPEVREDTLPVAVYHSANGDIPIYSAIGDHQAAVLGTCAEEGDIVINIGTGGQISYVDGGLAFGEYETRPFLDGHSLRAFTQLPSGRSLNVLMNFIVSVGREIYGCEDAGGKDIWGRVDALTKAGRSEVGKPRVDFSFFKPAGGRIEGIREGNFTIRNLIFGIYDSMAESYFETSGRLLRDGECLSDVVCTGGVVRKTPLLFEYIKEKFRCPCRLAPYSDDTMIGLLRYARWCREKQPLFSLEGDR